MPTSPRRGFLKKLSLVSAGASFTCFVLSLGLAIWSWLTYGKQHVYTGSLGATSFFFFTAAIVLRGLFSIIRRMALLAANGWMQGGGPAQGASPGQARQRRRRRFRPQPGGPGRIGRAAVLRRLAISTYRRGAAPSNRIPIRLRRHRRMVENRPQHEPPATAPAAPG